MNKKKRKKETRRTRMKVRRWWRRDCLLICTHQIWRRKRRNKKRIKLDEITNQSRKKKNMKISLQNQRQTFGPMFNFLVIIQFYNSLFFTKIPRLLSECLYSSPSDPCWFAVAFLIKFWLQHTSVHYRSFFISVPPLLACFILISMYFDL